MGPERASTGQVTRELPSGEQRPLEGGRVVALLRRAIDRTLEDLRSFPVPVRATTVFRGDESEVGGHEVLSPVYRDTSVWERIAQVWNSPEFMELADYLWERGAMKKTISGPDPGKDAWARFVFGDLVHSPLLIALEWTAREALVDAKPPVPWAVDEPRLQRIVREACAFHSERKGVATGYCPLGNVSLPPGVVHELASDITLKQFTSRERNLFLMRWQGEYLWDDFKSPLLAPLMAEVDVPFTVINIPVSA